MARPITNGQLKKVAAMVRDWPSSSKLTWDAICKDSAIIIGYVPTRQALSGKPLLANAYKTRKMEIKAKSDALSAVPKPKSMPAAMEKILRLSQENERLKQELSLMAETAQRFIHNASLHGLTRPQLMKPLPKINRNN
jgi:hypothetical protein